jgi:hypothetical protein
MAEQAQEQNHYYEVLTPAQSGTGIIIQEFPKRIRQLVAKALRKICAKARRDLIQGRIRACAALILYVERMCKPKEPEFLDRCLAFAQRALPHLPLFTTALPLLIALLPQARSPHIVLRDLRSRAKQRDGNVHL